MAERRWSRQSRRIRSTLDSRLQVLVDEILVRSDISLTYGYRDRESQNTLFENNRSKVKYPNSKHNSKPSKAVDLQPYPYPKKDLELWAALGYIAGLAMMISEKHGWILRWGGDWNRNGSVTDNNFDDLFHLEILDD